MMKRISAILMAIVLVWTMVPVGAAADVSTQKSGDYEYQSIQGSNNVKITKYVGTDSKVDIPSMIETYTVTSISGGAFKQIANLKSVTIPDTVTYIGESAFASCVKLVSIHIPNSVLTIASNAFSGDLLLKNVYYGGNEDQWKAITIENNNTFLTDATIHYNSVSGTSGTTKYEYAKLTDDTVQITDYSGNDTDLEIPSTLDGMTVTSIGTWAFLGCNELKNVEIPDTVTEIGEAAFSNCIRLEEVTLPEKLTSLGVGVFEGCSSLKSITIPEGITRICKDTFNTCRSLASVTIPAGVSKINDNAFNVTPALKDIYYGGSQSQWSSIKISSTGNDVLSSSSTTIHYAVQDPAKAISGCTISFAETATYTSAAIEPEITVKDGTTTLTKGTDYTVAYKNNVNAGTATVTITGTGKYTGTVNKSFTITQPTTSLEAAAVTLETTTYTYDGKAKEPAVKSVVVGTTTLKSGTDYKATYANNTNVGTATVTITGAGNYTGTAMTTFTITAASLETAAATLETRSYIYDGKAKTPKVTSVKVGTTTLKENTDYTLAYKDNTEIGTGTVTITGKGNYTGKITKIFLILKDTVSIEKAEVTLSKTSYTYNGKAKKPTVKSVKVEGVELQSGTDYTVSYKNNKNIGTATVTITGKENYTGTVTQTFEITAKTGTVFQAGSYSYKVMDSDQVAFTGLKKSTVKRVPIPETVKYGGHEFDVTSVAAKALKGTKATTVIVGDHVKTIGKSAFEGCSNLKSVTLGTGVTEIGARAFKGCSKLSRITIESTLLSSVGAKAFSGIKSTARINVPDEMLETYTQLMKGKGQGKKVKIK
jgi:hypothetical protein